MRIPSGATDLYAEFVAVNSSDLITRLTGLTGFTVYRARNGATLVAYTTPTIVELSAANMPGVYALLVDEDTTVDTGHDDESYCLHFTQASMAPVTRSLELYRPKFTVGSTVTAADIAAIKAKTDNLPADPADASDIATATTTIAGYIDTEVAAIKAKTDNLPSDPADASDIAAAFATVNSTLGTISGYIDTEVAAIKAKTDLIPATPVTVGDIPTAIQNADALLNRDMSTGTDSGSPTVRTPRQALRFLRNKWTLTGTTLSVKKEDDTTESWSATATVTPGASPITGNDPA